MQLKADAYLGRAGELVDLMHKQGHTEASREGVLAHILAFVGNYVGKDTYIMVGDDKHQPIIWPVIVGETAAGKGTSSGPIRRAFRAFDQTYMKANLVAGLGSGEGIIDRLSPETDDDGVEHYPDPRLLVIEEEFTSVLRKGRRENSILSNTLQTAWDGKPLGTLNRKSNSYAADDHHVTVIGHVTPRGLDDGLSATDFSNGFVNRLTFIRVRVQPAVARPLGMSNDELNMAVSILTDIFRTVKRGEYRLTEEAWKLWELNHETFRITGDTRAAEALGRTRPQILRTALIYAIIDCSHVVDARHMKAAAAVIGHSIAAVRQLFGDDELTRTEKVLAKIRGAEDQKLPEREIRRIGYGGRNSSSADAKDWFQSLLDQGLIVDKPTEGRKTRFYTLPELRTGGQEA